MLMNAFGCKYEILLALLRSLREGEDYRMAIITIIAIITSIAAGGIPIFLLSECPSSIFSGMCFVLLFLPFCRVCLIFVFHAFVGALYVCMYVCVCVCVCVFIKLHITTQSGPVILVILCHSH